MTPERWDKINHLFHAALQREDAERCAFIAENCIGDDALRDEIAELLAIHQHAQDFIEAPAADVAADMLSKRHPGLTKGEEIGPYKIIELLGAGGMGEVYLAADTRLNRQIALKVLPAQFTISPHRLRRFGQEARAASSLNHPNIVTIYEIGQANSHHFIASEFIDGTTLRDRMTQARTLTEGRPAAPLTLSETLGLAVQIGEALAAAHEAGIVHRDIKPENIMVRRDGYVKVLDFGLAKLTEREAVPGDEAPTRPLLKTQPGLLMGTANYMSPEQARGRDTDARTDIWSLGVLIYEMLTGQVPFEGETPTEVMARLIEREPVPISQSAPDLPAELQRIVHRALAKDPERRYQSSKEMLVDLQAFKQEWEFSAQLERSRAPGKFRIPSAGGTSRETRGFPSEGGATNAYSISSAEYLANGIRRYKRVVLFASATIVLGIAAIAYFSYFARGNSGEAIDSLAVLPFVNARNDPDTDYLSEGLSDGLIESLSHLPNLKRVAPFNSVSHFKGQQVDPLKVGRELKVRALLMSRLTKHGDDLLISTELFDVKDNKRLWSKEYDRKMADLPKLQGEIAQDVAENLRLSLTGQQKERLTRRYTENSEAYQFYKQGLYYQRKGTDEDRIKSREFFQQAIEKDPNFALGYSGLADAYILLAVFGQTPPRETWEKAEEAAVKALAIDDSLCEAHASVAGIKRLHDWDWPGAEREFKRAIELDPESARPHAGYIGLLESLGRFDEAIAEVNRLQELDPESKRYLGEILYFARRYDDAVADYQKAIEEGSGRRPAAYLDLGEIYVQQGRYEEALAEMPKALAVAETPRQLARMAYVYAAAGKRDEATKTLTEVKGLTSQRYDLGAYIAAIYAALGNKEQAFAWLNKACDARERGVFDLKVSPRWDPLRSDPRFTALLWRMKLAS